MFASIRLAYAYILCLHLSKDIIIAFRTAKKRKYMVKRRCIIMFEKTHRDGHTVGFTNEAALIIDSEEQRVCIS